MHKFHIGDRVRYRFARLEPGTVLSVERRQLQINLAPTSACLVAWDDAPTSGPDIDKVTWFAASHLESA